VLDKQLGLLAGGVKLSEGPSLRMGQLRVGGGPDGDGYRATGDYTGPPHAASAGARHWEVRGSAQEHWQTAATPTWAPTWGDPSSARRDDPGAGPRFQGWKLSLQWSGHTMMRPRHHITQAFVIAAQTLADHSLIGEPWNAKQKVIVLYLEEDTAPLLLQHDGELIVPYLDEARAANRIGRVPDGTGEDGWNKAYT